MNGEQVQMGSFAGYKLVGVNPHSANVGVAMMLADYITNEANQQKRFEDRQLGPSNINVNASEAVQAAPAIAALAAQSDFSPPLPRWPPRATSPTCSGWAPTIGTPPPAWARSWLPAIPRARPPSSWWTMRSPASPPLWRSDPG